MSEEPFIEIGKRGKPKERFDPSYVFFKTSVPVRTEGWETLIPKLNLQWYSKPGSIYGPAQLIFDRYHPENPKLSKPQAFANMTPTQLIQLSTGCIRLFVEMHAGRFTKLEAFKMAIGQVAQELGLPRGTIRI